MIQGVATLVLDLGNSQTRGILRYGKDPSGKTRERYFELPNSFAMVEPNYVVPADYKTSTSSVFELSAVVQGKPVSGTFCNGELCDKEFTSSAYRPSALEKKYDNLTTALSFAQSILKASNLIVELTRASGLDQLDITWNVVALLPPADVDAGAKVLEEMFRSVKHINFKFPNIGMPVKLDKVLVFPEGFSAYVGVLYEKDSSLRVGYENLENDTILVLDIGAGTTDYMIIKENKVLDYTKETSDIGGNNVAMMVRREIKNLHGIGRLPESDVATAVKEGYVRDGNRNIDVTDIVNKAKTSVATNLVNEMRSYFEENQFPIRTINRILVCGGGALAGNNNQIISLSGAIINYLRKLAPYVESIAYPTVITVDEETQTTREVQINPRELNILGADILALVSGL